MESATYNNLLFRTLADTVFWWLDRYEKFRKHLEGRYPVVFRDNNPCVILDLPERATKREAELIHTVGRERY